ncbi:hypothetical protein ACFQ2B_11255 [Streptomyces stramineus]
MRAASSTPPATAPPWYQVITTITGTVEKGRYQGRSVVQTVTLPQPDLLQCLSTGLTGATGVTTLSIG